MNLQGVVYRWHVLVRAQPRHDALHWYLVCNQLVVWEDLKVKFLFFHEAMCALLVYLIIHDRS